jgi:hypothetical protein
MADQRHQHNAVNAFNRTGKAPMTVDEVTYLAVSARAMASRIGHDFVLNDRKLEMLGLTKNEIDQVHARYGTPITGPTRRADRS